MDDENKDFKPSCGYLRIFPWTFLQNRLSQITRYHEMLWPKNRLADTLGSPTVIEPCTWCWNLMKFYLAMSTLDMVNIIYVKSKHQELLYLNIQSWNFQLGIGISTEGWRQFIICQDTRIQPTKIWLKDSKVKRSWQMAKISMWFCERGLKNTQKHNFLMQENWYWNFHDFVHG